MLKFKLDCLVENKNGKSSDKVYTVYVLLYDDVAPDIILSKLCLNYRVQKDFEITLRTEIQKYKALTKNIDLVKVKVNESLRKIEGEVIL